MTIYLVEWSDNNADYVAQRKAYRTKEIAEKLMNRLIEESKTNKDITPPYQVEKCVVRTKDDLANLINGLK